LDTPLYMFVYVRLGTRCSWVYTAELYHIVKKLAFFKRKILYTEAGKLSGDFIQMSSCNVHYI